MSKKPFACKIGWHNTYYDSSLTIGVRRCSNCAWVGNKWLAVQQDAERQAISDLPDEPIPTLAEIYQAAYKARAKFLKPAE